MTPDRPAAPDDLVARLVGGRIVATEPARWGFSNQTRLVTAEDGRRFAVGQLVGGPLARDRIRVARLLPSLLDPAGVPTPRLVAADPDARPALIVTSFVAGTPGPELLANPAGAVALAVEMGRLARRLREVPPEHCRLPSAWADPLRLASVAGRWLGSLGPELEPSTCAGLADAIARLPVLFAGRRAVLAHGDWVPANVIVDRSRVVAVLDWEFARLADPLFDIAWWGWIVAFHHPEVHRVAWPVFLEAAEVDSDPATAERLRSLVALRLLEALTAARRAGDSAAAATWAERLGRTVAGGIGSGRGAGSRASRRR